VNLLLYAYDTSSSRHSEARAWLEETLSGTETVALAWSVLVAFLRLATKAAVFEVPLSLDEALDAIDSWLDQPVTTVVHPTDRHSVVVRELLGPLGTAGNLTTDAHLAALAVEHGAELWSYDSDLSRFSGIRWRQPQTR